MTTINPPSDQATLPSRAAAFKTRLPIRARYDNWIGGEYVPPARGQYFEQPDPDDRPARSARSPAPPTKTSTRRSTPRTPRRSAGTARRPPTAPTSSTGSPTGWRPTSRRSRSSRRWTTASRSARPWRADLPLAIDHFRYFAGAHPGPGGRPLRARRGHRRLPLPRAARRRRPDHPVELPAADGDLEAGARRSPPGTAS